VRWLSPFRYYELSAPLPPGGSVDWRAIALLVAVAAGSAALAALAFRRRDVNAALIVLPSRPHHATFEPAPGVWRVPVVRELFEQRLGIGAWTLGMAIAAAVFVGLTRTVVNVLLNVPSLLPYLAIYVRQQLYPAVLGYTWLNLAQLLIAGYALAQVARWAAEDADGRLELYLSQPRSRAAIVVERAATLGAGVVLIAIVTGAVLVYASQEAGIDLERARVVAACAMLVPFALVFSGAGALLSAWNPRAAVGALGAFALLSYLDTELATIFRLPSWLGDLSAFRLFGTPLLTGVDGRSLTLLVCLALAGIGGSILAMQRRDVGA
jgi:ABC-2 type transport system permease protein